MLWIERGIGVDIFGGYCSGWMDSVALLLFLLFCRQRDFFVCVGGLFSRFLRRI